MSAGTITYGPVKIERWKSEQSGAGAYLRPEHYLFHANCSTTIGQLMCGPYVILPLTASHEELGSALLEVLAAARRAEPPELTVERKKLFATARVRSWKALHTATRHCHVSPGSSNITISPMRLERGAFVGVPGELLVAQPALPSELGGALIEGFTRCPPNPA